MWVLENCSFETLNNRIHNTLRLTNDQFVDEIYYRQPSIDVGQQYFFHSLQLRNDDDVCTMLMWNEQYSHAGPIQLLYIINRTPGGILNLLRSTITPTHDAMLYYNGKWKIPWQGDFLDYSFTGTNPIRFEIPSGCNIKTLKDQASCTFRGSPLWNLQIIGVLAIVLSTDRPYKISKKINRIWNNRAEKQWRRVNKIQLLEAFLSNFSYFNKPVTQPAPITDVDVVHDEQLATTIQME